MNRYFTEQQKKYFTESDSSLIQYLFCKEFPDYAQNFHLTVPGKKQFTKELNFLFKRNKNDFAGDIRKWDKISKGTLWNLYLYVLLGFDCSDSFIKNSIDYLNKNFLLPSGGFSFGWTPLTESSLWTGEYLYLILKAGYKGNEVQLLKNWIVQNQNEDGGWFISPLKSVSDVFNFVFSGKVKIEKQVKLKEKSCIFSTISCLQALLEYQKIFGKHDDEIIEKGAFYLLSEQILFKNKLESLDGFEVNKDFQSIGISMFGQIDIIKYLDIMSQTSYKKHKLVTPAYNYLIKEKTFEEGWLFNSTADYNVETEFGIKKFTGVDYFATLKILKILSRYN